MSPLIKRLIESARESWRLVVHPSDHERTHSMKSRYGRAAIVTTAGLIFSRFVSLGVGIALARMLGAGDYGSFGFVQYSLNMLATLCAFSMGTTAARNIAFYRDTDRERCARIVALGELVILALGLVGVLATWFFAGPMAHAAANQVELSQLLRIAAPMVAFDLIGGLQVGVLTGMERFRAANLLSVAGGLLTGLGGITGAVVAGLPGAVAGWTAGCGLSAALNWMVTWSILRKAGLAPRAIAYRTCFSEREIIRQYSLPATIQSLLAMGGAWTAQALVLRSGESGSSQLGAFTVANQWRWAALYLPSMLANLTMPFLANLHGSGQSKRLFRLVKYQLLFNSIFALTATAGIAIIAPWIVKMYGRGYADALPCLWILSGSLVFASFNTVMKQRYVGLGFMWSYTSFLVPYTAVLIATILIFLHSGFPSSLSFAWSITIAEVLLSACFALHAGRTTSAVKTGGSTFGEME